MFSVIITIVHHVYKIPITNNGLHVAWDIIIEFMIIKYVHDRGTSCITVDSQ